MHDCAFIKARLDLSARNRFTIMDVFEVPVFRHAKQVARMLCLERKNLILKINHIASFPELKRQKTAY
ncbi:hypothetical protein SDC9_200359 [bioreactor metagenome]|uniref:Uncharacterized protein n=1 Tax=bioreactor metagenome TaxID=1076179 RepID=A0A645IN59_9ZZZZ